MSDFKHPTVIWFQKTFETQAEAASYIKLLHPAQNYAVLGMPTKTGAVYTVVSQEELARQFQI